MSIMASSPTASAPLFNLSDLPYVPLLRILRFLDEDSLKMMRQTSKSINQFALQNRGRTVWKRVDVVAVLQNNNSYTHVACDKNSNWHRLGYFVLNSPSSTSVIERLAKKFSNCRIGFLTLEKFHFDERELNGMERAMVKWKMSAQHVEFCNPSLTNPRRIIRFLSVIRPREFTILGDDSMVPLFADTFFNFISTLEYFKIWTYRKASDASLQIKLPAQLFKIPKVFMTPTAFILPLSRVVEAIRTWYDSDEEFGCWFVATTEEECADNSVLSEAIGLSYERMLCEIRGELFSALVFLNRGGKKIYLCDVEHAEQANWRSWVIEGDPYYYHNSIHNWNQRWQNIHKI